MEVERIDHIHFKTNNMERDTRLFEGLLGKKFPFKVDVSTLYGLRSAFHPSPLGINLVEVTGKVSEMAQMYSEAPEGIFAISLKVPDIEKATAEMVSMGYKLLYREDSGPIKEALFDTKKAFTLYIELVETPGGSVMDLLEEASARFDSYSVDKTS